MENHLKKGQWATCEQVCQEITQSGFTNQEIAVKAKRLLDQRIDDLLRQLPTEDLVNLILKFQQPNIE